MSLQTGFGKGCLPRRFATIIGLLVGLAPAVAHAQTNIDQGKTPAQIWANDCAACHKTPRGLSNGRSSMTLASFLREHYTSSREQAAALAAYVLGAGGGPPTPAQARGQRPGTEQKPTEQRPTAAQPPEPANRAARGRPEEPTPATAARPGQRPTTASRGRQKGPEAPEQEPAAIVAEPEPRVTPAPAVAPAQEEPGRAAQSAAAPATTEPGENAPVPRDNVPD